MEEQVSSVAEHGTQGYEGTHTWLPSSPVMGPSTTE